MKYRWPWYLGLIVIVAAALAYWIYCGASTTVLLVRHADRNGTLDELSEAGQTRARDLVHAVERAGIDAIIRSDAVRAEQTSQLLATALGIAPIALPGGNVQAFASEIRGRYRGKTVLVVGHSNTVTPIIEALGGPSLPGIAEAEFDNLYVLQVCRCSRGPAQMTHLQYGAASP